MYMQKSLSYILPVIVSITQCSDRNLECLPHWIQCIFHNFCLVADCKTAINKKKLINIYFVFFYFFFCIIEGGMKRAVIIHRYNVHIK